MIRRPFTTLAAALVTAVPAAAGSDTSLALDLSAGILATAQDETTPAADSSSPADPSATPVPESDEALAKQTQNPVANLISVPFQNNFTFGTGPGDGVLWVLNIQPVIPFELTDDWNLITRTIIPVIHQPGLIDGASSDNGIGDVQFTAFLSPSKSEGLTWGLGPVLRVPTATRDTLGTEKWSAGPSAVALVNNGPWVVGGLVQQVWSFAGDDDRRDVSELLIQPFINYNLPDSWYLSTAPIITRNWKARNSDDRWTVPLGGGVGKIVRFGRLPVNLQLQAYYNVVRPDPIGAWTVRFQIQLLFPR